MIVPQSGSSPLFSVLLTISVTFIWGVNLWIRIILPLFVMIWCLSKIYILLVLVMIWCFCPKFTSWSCNALVFVQTLHLVLVMVLCLYKIYILYLWWSCVCSCDDLVFVLEMTLCLFLSLWWSSLCPKSRSSPTAGASICEELTFDLKVENFLLLPLRH